MLVVCALAITFFVVAVPGSVASEQPRHAKKACPNCDYELPSTYAIANGRQGPAQRAAYRGEFFDVYSKPIRTRYGEVVNVFNFHKEAPSTVPLNDEIVSRFNGSVMAITGFETNIVEFDENGVERLVPCTAMYNHHWSHAMLGADSPSVMTDNYKYYDYIGASTGSSAGDVWVGPSHQSLHALLSRRAEASLPKKTPRATPPAGESLSAAAAPSAQFFSEGNGNEHRLSFHGYARGYAQLIRSPRAFAPGIMFINTKDVTGESPTGHGRVVPSVALARGDDLHSALLECPCGTRRKMNASSSTIDGRRVSFGCSFAGEGGNRGRAMLKYQKNTACQMDTLHGSSKCCENGMVLLDEDQEQPEEVSTFYYKQRFYFDDGSHGDYQNLFRVYWQAELMNNEYDVPSCSAGTALTECVFVLTNEAMAKETFWSADPTAPGGAMSLAWPEDGSGIKLIYAGGHCHVGCLSLDLINLDSGAVICHQEPLYGTRVGPGDNAMDEAGYAISIPPCVWGEDPREDLSPPVVIKPTDRLQIIARYNATRFRQRDDPSAASGTLDIAHYGVMSMFQMRAAFEAPPPGFHV